MSMTVIIALIAFVVIVVAGIATMLFLQKRRTGKLRGKFGGAEYDRTVRQGGSRKLAEARLASRTGRGDNRPGRPLAAGDRTRFEDSWRRIQGRFVDGPAGAVLEADQLLGDVMSTRGYPVSDFEQRAADISVDHPHVLANYRTAHDIALRQTKGQASTEDLRQAIIHYRSLFEELVGDQALAT